MTGKLLLDSEPGPYARAIFELDQGLLVYDDIRHFGRIEWSAKLLDRAAALGPDALDIPLEDFLKLLKTATLAHQAAAAQPAIPARHGQHLHRRSAV